jgi:nicotinate phosphoribosyltransferase
MKLSTGKATLPGRKHVYRFASEEGDYDLIALEDEHVEGGRPLLTRVMAEGAKESSEPLTTLRQRCAESVSALPSRLLGLEGRVEPYEVRVSERLHSLVEQMHKESH